MAYSNKRRSRRRSSRRKSSGRKKCGVGYVLNKSTKKCVFATGAKGRKLNKKRAAVKKSHKRSGRPSPSQSATLYSVGFRMTGNDGNTYKIIKAINGVKRWQKA